MLNFSCLVIFSLKSHIPVLSACYRQVIFFLEVIFSFVPRGYGDLILVMVFTGFLAKFFCGSSFSANHFPYGFPPFFLYFVKIYAISL